jgi:hypothetical protein
VPLDQEQERWVVVVVVIATIIMVDKDHHG